MKKADFPYSLKNIPIPSKDAYMKCLISKTTDFIQKIRWKAKFALKPTNNNYQSNETFGLKSLQSAPECKQLVGFENDLINVIYNLEFKPNNTLSKFQKQLSRDVSNINSSQDIFVPADKTPNVYKVSKQRYEELLLKNVTAHYTKDRHDTATHVNKEASVLCEKLNIANRVEVMSQQQCYLTIKDHKDNFQNDTKCRLINPSKSQVGIIAKKKLQAINSMIRFASDLKQWRSTTDVIEWFKNIQFKTRRQFLQLDIEEFYPSITEELFRKALDFAATKCTVSNDDFRIIMNASKSILFSKGEAWTKSSGLFDITMGAYHGAEVCELVGLFMLDQMQSTFPQLNFGLYRDDGLGDHRRMPGPDLERMKKGIVALFKSHGLRITIETKLRQADFLDTTLSLEHETYSPFRKPNSAPLYIHKDSNHPRNVTKQLPKSISKRLSLISCSKEIFEEASGDYNKALADSGYKEKVQYVEEAAIRPSRNRQRKVTWYNPPYNASLKTNLGKKFLELIDKHFTTRNPLSKVFNRNTLKIGYSCTKNMRAVIQGHNNKIVNKDVKVKDDSPTYCNCTKRACPLDGECRTTKCVIYHATVQGPSETKNYIGLTEGDFKTRYGGHIQSFTDSKKKSASTLAKYVWANNLQPEPNVTYRILQQRAPYKPGMRDCDLCLSEKLAIMGIAGDKSYVNTRNEIKNTCLHKYKHRLADLLE